jgi:hypothetical protein
MVETTHSCTALAQNAPIAIVADLIIGSRVAMADSFDICSTTDRSRQAVGGKSHEKSGKEGFQESHFGITDVGVKVTE